MLKMGFSDWTGNKNGLKYISVPKGAPTANLPVIVVCSLQFNRLEFNEPGLIRKPRRGVVKSSELNGQIGLELEYIFAPSQKAGRSIVGSFVDLKRKKKGGKGKSKSCVGATEPGMIERTCTSSGSFFF